LKQTEVSLSSYVATGEIIFGSGGSEVFFRGGASSRTRQDAIPPEPRHASMRSLERYARPGPEALARHAAATDPSRRGQR